MTINVRKTYLFAIAALSLAACSSDEEYGGNEPVAAQITASIGNSASSRAAGTSWTSGDKIGITARSGAESKYVNMEYTTEAGDGKFTGTPMYFKVANDEVTFTAYYPFAGAEGTDPAIIEGNTRAPQQTADNQPAIDYLWDSRTGTKDSPNVNFNFAHKMSQITLTFQDGTASGVDEIESYSLGGLVVEGTFNTATGEAKAKDIQPEALKISVDNAASGIALPSVIVYPQAAARPVELSIVKEGETYQCELPIGGGELKAGTDYRFTVTLNKKSLAVSGCTISPWGDGGSFTGDANIPVPPIGNKTVENAAAGDFYMSDGSFVDKDATLTEQQKRACVAIVFSAGQSEYDLSDYSGTGIKSEKCHGYAVAISDATDSPCMWGVYGDELGCGPTDANGKRPNLHSNPDVDWNGYAWTQKIIAAAGGRDKLNGTEQSGYPATYYAVVAYEARYNAPAGSSGWFLPAVGQLWNIFQNRSFLFDGKEAVTGLRDKFYHSSSEQYDDRPKWNIVCVDAGGDRRFGCFKYSDYIYVRPILAF